MNMYNIFFQPVSRIINIKKTTQDALKRIGIESVRDLVFYRPISFNINNLSPILNKVKDDDLIQAEVKIGDILTGKGRAPTKIYATNESGEILLVFFNKIPSFIYVRLRVGTKITISGKVKWNDGMPQITHPEFIFKKELQNSVEPIYPLTYGLKNKQLFDYIIQAINILENSFNAIKNSKNNDKPYNPQNNIFENEIIYFESLICNINNLHLMNANPNHNEIEKNIAYAINQLKALELFANQVSLNKFKKQINIKQGRSFEVNTNMQQEVLDNLGFTLTDGQQSAIAEIQQEQQKNTQMMRMLQGDVGSGKTLVALLTALNAMNSGAQVAIMAPTDLLSAQHHDFFTKALAGTDFKTVLLTGKTKKKEKEEIKKALSNGEVDILIGTHALFQDNVKFKDLGFIVIDEQHRFGVEQRLELINKGRDPDVLVMTATPIPRSLTLTVFGDMGVSQIKTKPKNRLPIITSVSSNKKLDIIIESLARRIMMGEKIYWVCPLIDQNDKSLEADEEIIFSDVMARFEDLNPVYPGKVAILHGKMKAKEKDIIMDSFKNGDIMILLATTVIEVGIDVPDATLMVIEDAQQFGLAGLHQLRGRVGRGSLQSYCVLIYNPKRFSANARQRLSIMKNSDDGFYISEQDLLLRGGGEILGTKQSGEPEFFFADLGRDLKILEKCNKLAANIEFSEFINFQTKLFLKKKEFDVPKN